MKLLKKKDTKPRDDHQFFVVVKPEGSGFKLESGWDKMEDAKNMARELPSYLNAKAFLRGQLKSMNLDPMNRNHWLED